MTAEIERLAAEERVRTMLELRNALRVASSDVLAKLAVDLVPPLFRVEYRGELAATGESWAEAYARPKVSGMPSFLVRVHSGPFTTGDAQALLDAMSGARVAQGALAIVNDMPLQPEVRRILGAQVPWLLDIDGLVHLMVNANVGVIARTIETKTLDGSYFR